MGETRGGGRDGRSGRAPPLSPPRRGHWSVWQRANTDESDHLTELTAELDLTPDQVDKIRASQAEAMKAMPRFDSQEVTAHIRAFGDAFRAQMFDAKTLATGGAYPSYWCGGLWFFRGEGGRWGHYDREPPGLYQHRMQGGPARRNYENTSHPARGGRGGGGGHGGGGHGGGGHGGGGRR